MLDKQIEIMLLDTANFYSNHEAYLHWLNYKIRVERNFLIKQLDNTSTELKKYNLSNSELNNIYKNKQEYNFEKFGNDEIKVKSLCNEYCRIKNLIVLKNKKINSVKNILLKLLSNKINENIKTNGKHHIRQLRNINASVGEKFSIYKHKDEPIGEEKYISVFDSSFTRIIQANQNELNEDFIIIQVFYFDIIKDLIYYGFMYKGEKYIYFTSSAGQIRTKKCVFVKESVWNKYEKTIMCGLSFDIINAKGGNNPNKTLAYLALNNSATDIWEDFDIDKTIVVDDFETNVNGDVDFIDDITYEIKRINMDVPVPHSDGCGIMLPSVGTNRMIRLPWVKGLLGQFDFRKFIEVHNCSSIVKDIYGEEHDVIKEDIQIIFTKSQFKMAKFYNSWNEYKENYKKYNCVAAFTNPEVERIKNATINYQMLQSLTDITEEEMYDISDMSINKLKNICSSINDVKETLGVTSYNVNQTFFQKAIGLYPNLINDISVKDKIRDIKDSMLKRYKSGKLSVHGKYTFILPDLYAFAEYLFLNDKKPKGLLDNGEVFCWLFKKADKLDCLRSPHLYIEHAIKNNVAYEGYDKERRKKLREWFCSNAIYTSSHDLISKILQ